MSNDPPKPPPVLSAALTYHVPRGPVREITIEEDGDTLVMLIPPRAQWQTIGALAIALTVTVAGCGGMLVHATHFVHVSRMSQAEAMAMILGALLVLIGVFAICRKLTTAARFGQRPHVITLSARGATLEAPTQLGETPRSFRLNEISSISLKTQLTATLAQQVTIEIVAVNFLTSSQVIFYTRDKEMLTSVCAAIDAFNALCKKSRGQPVGVNRS